mgnify:CR=1 FL=1
MTNYQVQVNNLFSTTVWIETFDFDTNVLSEECLRIKESDPGRVRTNKGGWQSSDIKFSEDDSLIERITSSTNAFAKHLSLKELQLSNIWININGHKDYNIRHDHPGAVLSGVYYVRVPENSGNIELYHPAMQTVARTWQDAILEYQENNDQRWLYNVKDNMLLLFPGWLEHQVEPNLSNEERISISFNFVVK